MSKLFRVVEIWANLEDSSKPHIKKDIGCKWKSETQAKEEMNQLKQQRSGMSFGIENKNKK